MWGAHFWRLELHLFPVESVCGIQSATSLTPHSMSGLPKGSRHGLFCDLLSHNAMSHNGIEHASDIGTAKMNMRWTVVEHASDTVINAVKAFREFFG